MTVLGHFWPLIRFYALPVCLSNVPIEQLNLLWHTNSSGVTGLFVIYNFGGEVGLPYDELYC